MTTGPALAGPVLDHEVEDEEVIGVEDQLSRLFAALADPIRRDTVARLAVGEATVGELAAPHPVSLQAVSKHLEVLEDAGPVRRSRQAQRRPASLEPDVLEGVTSWVDRHRRLAEERCARLDAVLAAMTGDHDDPADPTTDDTSPRRAP